MSNGYVSPEDVPASCRPEPEAWEAICALHAAGRLQVIYWDVNSEPRGIRTTNPFGVSYQDDSGESQVIYLAHVVYDDEAGLHDRRRTA